MAGRIDAAFDDRNESVVDDLLVQLPELHTLEMETFHLYALLTVGIHLLVCH